MLPITAAISATLRQVNFHWWRGLRRGAHALVNANRSLNHRTGIGKNFYFSTFIARFAWIVHNNIRTVLYPLGPFYSAYILHAKLILYPSIKVNTKVCWAFLQHTLELATCFNFECHKVKECKTEGSFKIRKFCWCWNWDLLDMAHSLIRSRSSSLHCMSWNQNSAWDAWRWWKYEWKFMWLFIYPWDIIA